MNLAGLQATLYDRLSYQSSPATAIVDRLLRFLNETQREILSKRGCSRLRRTVLPFSSVANSPFAVLPQSAVRILAIVDRTNGRPLEEITLADLRSRDPMLTQTASIAYEYVINNLSAPLAQDPTAAATLFTVSDAAGDGNTKKVFVEGVITGGYYRTASVALNGITEATLGITNWIALTKFYIALAAGGATSAAGNIILTQGSAGTELGRIPIGKQFARYSRVQLHPTPTGVATYYADVELHIEDMAQAGDEPYLPEDFHWLLVAGTLMKEYQKRQDSTQWGIESRRFKDGFGDLIAFCRSATGVSQGRGGIRFSQLGPQYPSGS